MKKLNSKKGFTLIEMLVVIAIIAILVAIIVPTVTTATKKSKAATDAANLRTVAAQIATDVLDNDTVDGSYSAECKSLTGTTTLEIYNVNNEIQAFFVNGGKYYGVDQFAAVAENGGTLAEATKPTTGQIWPK